MFRACALILAGIFLSSCGASVDPLLQSRIAGEFSKRSTATYPDAGLFRQAPALAVGQWVLIGTTTKDGERSIARTAIVGREQGGWIIETSSTTPSAESTTQMLVTGMEEVLSTQDLDKLDIIWVKMKSGDEPVQKLEGPALLFGKGTYRKLLANSILSLSAPGAGGSVTVPAGTFHGTTKARSEVSILWMTVTSDSWFHPSVPIGGMVKAVDVEGESTSELLAFGMDGATPSI